MNRKIVTLLAAGAALAALGGCVDEGGYAGVDAGYGYAGPGYGYAGGPGWDYYGNPDYYGFGYGWYGDSWYPGTGVLVYDRAGHGRRWNHGERDYWHSHGPRPGMPASPWHGRPGGHWTPPPHGGGFAGGIGRSFGPHGGHGHHH